MKYIAQRKLLFCEKDSDNTREFIVKVSEPFLATDDNASFIADGIVSCCRISFEGLDEASSDMFGMDSLQALNLATNINPLLERFRNKYDFYWMTGEPYFDD